MSAYVISRAEIVDEAAWERYRSIAGPASALYGGSYLARGAVPVLAENTVSTPLNAAAEGDERMVTIIQFPSMQRLLQWYDSNEYAEAREIARFAARRQLLFVEGV